LKTKNFPEIKFLATATPPPPIPPLTTTTTTILAIVGRHQPA